MRERNNYPVTLSGTNVHIWILIFYTTSCTSLVMPRQFAGFNVLKERFVNNYYVHVALSDDYYQPHDHNALIKR